jgi:hypothetical protein
MGVIAVCHCYAGPVDMLPGVEIDTLLDQEFLKAMRVVSHVPFFQSDRQAAAKGGSREWLRDLTEEVDVRLRKVAEKAVGPTNEARFVYSNDGIGLIARERDEQIMVHRYDSDHDDKHTDCALSEAACCYAQASPRRNLAGVPVGWPFDDMYYNGKATRVQKLAKAGALIAAEIDRELRVIRAEKLPAPSDGSRL